MCPCSVEREGRRTLEDCVDLTSCPSELAQIDLAEADRCTVSAADVTVDVRDFATTIEQRQEGVDSLAEQFQRDRRHLDDEARLLLASSVDGGNRTLPHLREGLVEHGEPVQV